MVLRITNSTEDLGISVCKVSLTNFTDKTYHPMLATTKWDRVYIDICDETPRGIIMQLVPRARVIPVILGEVTPKMLQVLCEILPDEASKLRYTYMKDKSEFRHLLDIFREEYWKE